MILYQAADEVAAGIIRSPYATDAVVARYAASLAEARDILVLAGVHFAVSGLMGDF